MAARLEVSRGRFARNGARRSDRSTIGLPRAARARFADGQLEIPVADRYRLADAAQALAQVAGGHTTGAVVLTP